MADAAGPAGLLTVAVRNGASTYTCRHCRAEFGAIRRTGDGVRVFAIAAGIANPERDHLMARIAGKIMIDCLNQAAAERGDDRPAVHSPTLRNPMPPAPRKPKSPRAEKTKRRK